MMSLSDKTKEEFTPINISSLDTFDDEKVTMDESDSPDWDQFKTVFENIKEKHKEKDIFIDLFDNGQVEKKAPVFDQLEGKKNNNIPDHGPSEDTLTDDSLPEEQEEIIDTKEDIQAQGMDTSRSEMAKSSEKEGFDQGFEEGFREGKTKGYNEGVKEGKIAGHKDGVHEGYYLGYEEGEKIARETVTHEIKEKVNALEFILTKLDQTYEEMASRYEEQMIDLVLRIAEKVVYARVETDDELIRNTVNEAIGYFKSPQEITLAVSKEDYDYIEMIKEDLFASISSLKTVTVEADASVHKGGCQVITSQGEIEIDISEKLDAIGKALKQGVGNGS